MTEVINQHCLSIKIPPALGDSVIATGLINALLQSPGCIGAELVIYAKHAWLFKQF
ncbi:hypothetical protein JW905_09270 [bacterium]|nr:hypothetical protein [candidate division CSSED10-310 bacterium]